MIRSEGEVIDIKFAVWTDLEFPSDEAKALAQKFLDECRDALAFYFRNGMVPLTGDYQESIRIADQVMKLARRPRPPRRRSLR
jgi:hypothetical protein